MPGALYIRGRYHCLLAAHFVCRGPPDLHAYFLYPDQHCLASYIQEAITEAHFISFQFTYIAGRSVRTLLFMS